MSGGGQADPPGSGWFLLVWVLLALPAGGALATRRGAQWFHTRLVRRRERRRIPLSRPAPVGLIRVVGAVFVTAAVVAVPFGIHLITR